MDEDAEGELEPADQVELVSDGENLLVIGEDRHSVEAFLQANGLLEKARELGRHQLVPALRSSADALKTVADAVAESSLWLKVTPESVEVIKEFGLTDSSEDVASESLWASGLVDHANEARAGVLFRVGAGRDSMGAVAAKKVLNGR